MSRALPTWAELAAQRRVKWCRGIQPNGQPCHENHKLGVLTGHVLEHTIHWTDRRASKVGIRHFLYAIAYGEEVLMGIEPEWRRRYWALRKAIHYVLEAGVRRPAPNWDKEKVRLKTMLLKVPTTDVDREEAMKWLLQ